MHLPDGFLDAKTWATMDVASAGVIAYAVKKTSEKFEDKQVPVMGVVAAFVFAAQMLNFPVLGGTSGHLVGAVLAAVLLGPWAATLVMTSVFIIQALFFQDGGIMALGANIFNMGIIGTVAGYYIFSYVRSHFDSDKGLLFGVFVASWISVVLAAVFTALELAFSGTSPTKVVVPAMATVHVFIGLGEAIITTAIVSFILKVRRDLVYGVSEQTKYEKRALPVVVAIIVMLILLSPFASSFPDGLEKAAEVHSFAGKASIVLKTAMADYALPGVANASLSTIIAGAIGAVLVFALAFTAGRSIMFKRKRRSAS